MNKLITPILLLILLFFTIKTREENVELKKKNELYKQSLDKAYILIYKLQEELNYN